MIAVQAAAVVGAPAVTTSGSAADAAQDQPNVIVIMADDMRTDDLAVMPQTRRLLPANYSNAYVSTPLCCPSRASFLSGQYPHNNGVWYNRGPHGGAGAFDDASTLATWLDPTYQTVMIGKYLNLFGSGETDGTPPGYVPPGWDHMAALTQPSSGNYTDFNVNVNGSIRHVENGYQTTYFGDRMVQQIQTRIGSDEPLFMWGSFFAPHTGSGDGPDRYVVLTQKYRGTSRVGLPTSPAVDEAKVGDKPPWIRTLPRLGDKARNRIIQHRRERRDSLMYVDDQIARVVAAVRAAGELDNTVIVFTSDNGFMLGEHRIELGKIYPYREAARVPLLIRGPGFTAGTHTDPVSNVDLAPTIAALADVIPGHVVDGRSLLNPVAANRPLLVEFLQPGVVEKILPYASVIRGRWQYTDYGTARELYDLDVDPWQQNNRIGANLPVKQTLRDQLAQLRNCVGVQCLPQGSR